MNNLHEYADPLIYDLENAGFEPDGPFYLALAGETGGPPLELGCGTGRISIPLAKEGFEVAGLDITPAMLERAKEKAGGYPHPMDPGRRPPIPPGPQVSPHL